MAGWGGDQEDQLDDPEERDRRAAGRRGAGPAQVHLQPAHRHLPAHFQNIMAGRGGDQEDQLDDPEERDRRAAGRRGAGPAQVHLQPAHRHLPAQFPLQ
ncbi:hypothetical protein CRUP_036698 [Coryphaenoides rupestris]|nr:hypothetical protein CRUP_036698 [Coryphaenoides rupestris]